MARSEAFKFEFNKKTKDNAPLFAKNGAVFATERTRRMFFTTTLMFCPWVVPVWLLKSLILIRRSQHRTNYMRHNDNCNFAQRIISKVFLRDINGYADVASLFDNKLQHVPVQKS